MTTTAILHFRRIILLCIALLLLIRGMNVALISNAIISFGCSRKSNLPNVTILELFLHSKHGFKVLGMSHLFVFLFPVPYMVHNEKKQELEREVNNQKISGEAFPSPASGFFSVIQTQYPYHSNAFFLSPG